jgi:DNA-binding transcriptional MocR family regulator
VIDNGKYADSMAACLALARLGVILVPGTLFDQNPGQAQGMNKIGVRVSFGAFTESEWPAQIDRLAEALTKIV